MNKWWVFLISTAYLLLLFGVAWFAERRAARGRSVINNPYVYALSLAVYCTAWTYYGSVGRATVKGVEYLAIYLGPTLVAPLFFTLLRRIIRITRSQRITSIADFVSARYGQNVSLGALVSVLSVVGVVPYISLQLKAITNSIDIITRQPAAAGSFNVFQDTAFYLALALTAFIILFGARSVDASERHEGMVFAVATESVVKLVALTVAGLFIVYGLHDGFADIFSRAAGFQHLRNQFALGPRSWMDWMLTILLSMCAILLLPRQFQVQVVEHVRDRNLKRAAWLFPLYLLAITIFVLPISIAGQLAFGSSANADTYVLTLPMYFSSDLLTALVYIGGFSAASSMVIVETIALSTMISNNLVLPLFLKTASLNRDENYARSILHIRRWSMVVLMALAYGYEKMVGDYMPLVSIGLVSFTAVAQFAPAVLIGMYWKGASRKGALAGIIAGYAIWLYTLILPSLAEVGILPATFVSEGPWHFALLKPYQLLGLEGFDPVVHAFFWSMCCNLSLFVLVSLGSRRTAQELYQAELFANATRINPQAQRPVYWKGSVTVGDLEGLLANFLGAQKAHNIFAHYARQHQLRLEPGQQAPEALVPLTERVLTGVVGAAGARFMMKSVVAMEEVGMSEMLNMLRESQQLVVLNKELRKKSVELEKATRQLQQVNERLRTTDQLKDEFLYTVTHELRTPITSIRAMAEIVHDYDDLEEAEKQQYLSVIIRESERLSHLITQVLRLERFESGRYKLNLSPVHINEVVQESAAFYQLLAKEQAVALKADLTDTDFMVQGDRDLLRQVVDNLVSNALKFTPSGGAIRISVRNDLDDITVRVQDTGKGIAPALHQLIFDKFFQARNQTLNKPEGSGLGLAISRKIVELHGGRMWVESAEGQGATFVFTLPG